MKFFYLLISISLFAAGLVAQTPAVANGGISEFDVNGLKVIVKRRTSSPTVSLGLFTRGGVRNQTEKSAGIENLTWSVATEASKSYPRADLRRELARTGTAIGGTSGSDFGGLSMVSTSEHFERSWGIFFDLFKNPSFDAADVDRIKTVIVSGLRDQSASADSELTTRSDDVIYAGHPYAVSAGGTIESVSALTSKDLRAFQQSMLDTSKLLLVVVGDTTEEQVKRLVTASFATIKRGTYKSKPIPQLSFTKPSLDVFERSLSTNYVRGYFAAPSQAEPDYYAMRVAMAILQSRVHQEVRVQRNLSYAPNAEMGSLAANSASIYVTAVDANQAVQVMLDEIKRLRTETVTEEGYAGIPGFFLTSYYAEHESNASQAGELGRYELAGGGWRRSLEFLTKVQTVTPAQIKAAAEKYMKNVRFVVVGDPKAIDRSIFLPK